MVCWQPICWLSLSGGKHVVCIVGILTVFLFKCFNRIFTFKC
uniref:Uncharacterized protein n=1 Tax=Anguilla anguilla TaxID=7936 RepID=A0A0E9SZ87_ANGAN